MAPLTAEAVQERLYRFINEVHGGGTTIDSAFVIPEAADYTFVKSDNGHVFTFNASSITATFPIPAPPEPWGVILINLNATPLSVTSLLAMNGVVTSLSLAENNMLMVWSNGTTYNYGLGGGSGGSGSASDPTWMATAFG